MNACFKANEMVSANSDLEFTMPEGFPRRRAAIGPLGEKLTLESLPPPQCNRWTPRRKAEVVAALTGGLLMEDEARERYSPFFDEGTFALSRADTDYDILILDSSDPVRMARYLRINRALLRNVAKFAIMQESSPSRRARMLMAGCDDVFDCARTSPEEAAVRVDAVMRRYKAREAIRQEGLRTAADMAYFAAPHTLTPRECALLKALAGQPGKAMSASQLCRFVAPQDAAQFKRSLKFAISRLRGKLYPHWRIRTAADTGYTLVRVDAGTPEVGVTGEVGRRRQTRMRLPQQELLASAFDQTRSAA